MSKNITPWLRIAFGKEMEGKEKMSISLVEGSKGESADRERMFVEKILLN